MTEPGSIVLPLAVASTLALASLATALAGLARLHFEQKEEER